MRVLMASALLASICTGSYVAEAGTTYVRPYLRSDGTYVQPHFRTTPDSSRLNNWSTRGNVNPFTGRPGAVDPFAYESPQLGWGRRGLRY